MSFSLMTVLALLGASLVALVVTGLSIFARLSYLWAFLLIGSWIWSKLALRDVNLRRRFSTARAYVGQIFEERFEVHNTARLPRLWMEVRDGSDLPGSRGSRVLTQLGSGERRSYRVRTRLVERGMFSLGPTRLVSGDLFGLFSVERTIPAESSLLVYPMMVELQEFSAPPGLLPGGEALRLRTHQVTPNASGVREYVPGDTMKRIHWPSTARHRHLMVKEFELDPLADVWLLLDAERDVQAALPYSSPDQAMGWQPWEEVTLPPSTLEYSVSIAASLGRYFLRRGRAVGLVSCPCASQGGLQVLAPDRGGRQLGKLLNLLAPLQAEGDLSIAALTLAHAQYIPRASTAILITPSVSGETALAVDFLSRRGVRPVVVLLDAASFGGAEGTDTLEDKIATLGAPIYRVEEGQDLSAALSVEARSAQQKVMPWRRPWVQGRVTGEGYE
jgi:uncharacterized protein (DUF58 family)